MSKQAEYLKRQMTTRMDFGTEEFCGRRILQGMGLNGSENVVTTLRRGLHNVLRDVDRVETVWDVASKVLRIALDANNVLPTHRNIVSVKCSGTAAAIKQLAELYDASRIMPGVIMCCRIKAAHRHTDSEAVLLPVEKTTLSLFEPPFAVHKYNHGYVVLEKGIKEFVEQFGPYDDTIRMLVEK